MLSCQHSADLNKMEKKLTFELTVNHTNKILVALSKRPYEEVHDVILSIQLQAKDQTPDPPTKADLINAS